MPTDKFMKKVEVHDTYKEIKESNGSIKHPFFINTSLISQNLSFEDAKKKVDEVLEESKKLGSYNINVYKDYLGYVDLDINFSDGRELKRIIYIIE